MNIPIAAKPALWGFACGAAALAIAGFGWGGWTTAGKADAEAAKRADTAVVAALAPLCVEKFRSAGNIAANLATLKNADSWSQGDLIEKGGWATMAGSGSAERVTSVARACAALLTAS